MSENTNPETTLAFDDHEPSAEMQAVNRAVERISTHTEIEGDLCFPGDPIAEAWCHRAVKAEHKLRMARDLLYKIKYEFGILTALTDALAESNGK